jgi:PAS domain S-box-containing protein
VTTGRTAPQGLSLAKLGLTRLVALLVGVMAVAILAGWAFGVSVLTSGLPGLVHTKVNAALSFLCLAVALSSLSLQSRWRRPLVWIPCGLLIAIMAATLLEYASGLSLGIDEMFAHDAASAGAPYPGRVAIQTAVALLACAAAILLRGRKIRRLHFTELLAMVAGVVGAVSFLGYLYGAQALESLGSPNQISLPASIALIGLAFGVIASDADHVLVREIADPSPSGQVLRRIVPAALIVVPLGAWLRLMGERAGLYDESVGLAILVTLEALVLVAIGSWATASMRTLVLQRRQAELDLVRLGSAVSTPLIETAPVGLAVVDRDLRYLYVNPALAAADGHDSLIHMGQRLDRISPFFGPDTMAQLEGVLRTGEPIKDLEISAQGAGQAEPRTWLLNAQPLCDERNEPIGLALSVVEITERKRREVALAALSELQKQAQVISESIPYGFWTADVEGRMRYHSQSFLNLLGRTEEEAQGLGWLESLAPEEAEETRRDMRDAVAARRQWTFEFAVTGSDGRSRAILSQGFPVRDANGKVTSWAGINLDITDRKSTEAFREAFAGIMGHELRTPITSINAATKLLSRAGLDEMQKSELLEDIIAESDRLRRLVEDLVVLARAERGTIQVHTEPVMLSHVLDKVRGQEQVRWPDRQIEFRVEGYLPVVRAEEALVEQILRNLIGNAAKYSGPGEAIEVVSDSQGERVRVRVLDRGPGVDPDETDRLFELFYRSPRTAKTAGSGIGLFVARRLVESMDGSIWARLREDGAGSEFGFSLHTMTEGS